MPNPRATATYAAGGVYLLTTLGIIFIIDLVGHKILLILSGIGVVIGTMLLGVNFYVTRPSLCASSSSNASTTASKILQDSAPCNTEYGPLAIVAIMTFGAAFSVGWGPIPWILLSELTPLRVRGVASGIATVVNWGTAAIVVGFYLSYANTVRVWFAWWSFMILNVAAVIFTIFFLREIKGKSLEQIENYYKTNRL